MAVTTNSNEQVNNSIKSIIELTTRIDERVQLMMKKQESFEAKIDGNIQHLNELKTEVKLLDSKSGKSLQEEVSNLSEEVATLSQDFGRIKSKIERITEESNKKENNWQAVVKGALSFIVQIIWVVVASYLLYKLGIQSPSVP